MIFWYQLDSTAPRLTCLTGERLTVLYYVNTLC